VKSLESTGNLNWAGIDVDKKRNATSKKKEVNSRISTGKGEAWARTKKTTEQKGAKKGK